MFETLSGTELPIPVRFFISFLIVLVLIGVTSWVVRRFKPNDRAAGRLRNLPNDREEEARRVQSLPYDREARRLQSLPLVISLCAFAVSLYALWVVEYRALPEKPSNPVDLTDAPTYAPTDGAADAVADASRAALYEEDPNDRMGKRLAGSTIWRADNVAAAGAWPELAVVAEVDIPERGMGMTWTLRRDIKANSSTSHTIEIMFRLPKDFPPGGISKVPGVWMKQAEQSQGTALAGLTVNVTTGYFLTGLSAAPADRARNIQLLKEQPWFEIPMFYTNNRRAILGLEKGAAGRRAFATALNAWEDVPNRVK